MQFNSIIFPAPESCYKYRQIKDIIYIPNPSAKAQPPKEESVQNQPPKEASNNASTKTSIISDASVSNEAIVNSTDATRAEAASNNQTSVNPKDSIASEASTVPEEEKTSDIQEKTEQSAPEENIDSCIPCLYLKNDEGSNKILLFFHGNAEDIGWAHDFVTDLRNNLGVHVLAVEYPGYSLYIGTPNANQICQDAEVVYDYLTQTLGVAEKNIILFGRSIGSGPATHLAARRNPATLVLMSAYTSISAVVENIAGAVGRLFVAERFKNIEEITKIRCPVLFIHGKADKLIPKSHAERLLHACTHTISHMVLPEKMTHNDFELEADIIEPIKKFLSNCDIKIVEEDDEVYDFPHDLYIKPVCWKGKANKPTLVQKIYDRFFN